MNPDAAWPRPSLRSLSRGDARALDVLHRRRLPSFDAAGRTWRLRWCDEARGPASPASACLRLSAAWGGHSIVVIGPRWLADETLAAEEPLLHGIPIPDELLETVLGTVAGEWLQALPGTRLGELAVYAGPALEDAGLHWLRATLQTQDVGSTRRKHGGARGNGLCAALSIGADSAALHAMGVRCRRLPARRRPVHEVLGVRTQLRCEVGRQTLSLAELRSLRPGDTVFIGEHVDHEGAHELRLYISNRCVLHAEVGPSNALTVTGMGMNHDDNLADGMASLHAPGDAADPDGRDGPLGANPPDYADDHDDRSDRVGLDERDKPGDPDVLDDAHHPDEEAGLGALADIPVVVTFDVGQCELTVGELRELVVGSIVELDRPLTDAVHLRAGGKLLGLGELIEIDGRIGVLVAQIGEAR